MERAPYILKESANQFDTIGYMREIAKKSAQNPIYRDFIQRNQIQGEEDLDRLYRSLYKFIEFERDPDELQTIRTGTRTLRDKVANCVDFTVLVSCFLQNMGVPHVFRMVAYSPGGYSHIYPVLGNGKAFDLVLGKEFQDVDPGYGKELPYLEKFDLPINYLNQ